MFNNSKDMDNANEIKNLITDSKNIYLFPAKEPEAITSALALFYSLKELGKNVNLLIDQLPESLKSMAPSLDFVSYPKNLVISIPKKVADVSQIYYEKNDEGLKIHLAVENGVVRKENVSFYFSETKPDLIITFGIKDYMKEISGQLDSFGFLLDAPILNIDTSKGSVQENKNFGKMNLVEEKPLLEIIMRLINSL